MEFFSAKAFVYLIQAETSKRVKIGWAVKPNKRLKMLQTGNPELLSILMQIRCRSNDEAKAKEAELHKKFNHLRLSGEWFDFGADIINFLFDSGALHPEKADEFYEAGRISERRTAYKWELHSLLNSMQRAEQVGVPLWYMCSRPYNENDNLTDFREAIDLLAEETDRLNRTGSIWKTEAELAKENV